MQLYVCGSWNIKWRHDDGGINTKHKHDGIHADTSIYAMQNQFKWLTITVSFKLLAFNRYIPYLDTMHFEYACECGFQWNTIRIVFDCGCWINARACDALKLYCSIPQRIVNLSNVSFYYAYWLSSNITVNSGVCHTAWHHAMNGAFRFFLSSFYNVDFGFDFILN